MSFVLSKPRSKTQLVVSEEGESVVSTDDSLNKCSGPPSSITEPSVKRLKIVKDEDDSVPLPDPFPLPKHYPHDIQCALNVKKMSIKDKQRFVSEIASAMLRFKRYPTRDDYLCVAKTVLDKYPFLKTSDKKPYVSACTCMCMCIYVSVCVYTSCCLTPHRP